jgi:hypothetical protein
MRKAPVEIYVQFLPEADFHSAIVCRSASRDLLLAGESRLAGSDAREECPNQHGFFDRVRPGLDPLARLPELVSG